MNIEAAVREALADSPDPAALARLASLVADLAGDERAVAIRRTRRRILLPALAAAAIVATVAGGTLVATHWPGVDRPPADSGPAPMTAQELRPVWKFSAGHVPGYTITRTNILRTVSVDGLAQAARITATTSPGSKGVFVLSLLPGTFQQRDKADGIPIGVGPYPGVFVAGKHVSTKNLRPMGPWDAADTNNEAQPRLFWQYPDGSWGSVQGDFGFRAASYDYDNTAARKTMTAIALAIRVGVNELVRMPFALTSLPGRLAPEGIRRLSGFPCIGYGTGKDSGNGKYDGEYAGSVMSACRVTTAATRSATLARLGMTESYTASVTVRDLPDGTSLIVEVDQGKAKLVSAKQAERLAATADVAPRLDDPSSWLVVD